MGQPRSPRRRDVRTVDRDGLRVGTCRWSSARARAGSRSRARGQGGLIPVVVVKDVYFAYVLVVLTVVAAVGYGVRLAVGRGAAGSERVGRIGGTALVGQELMDWTYWAVEPIVRALVAIGATPNGLTWSALVLGVGAGVALGFGLFGLATLLATMSVIGDILDGQVARLTSSGSNRGERLDPPL